VKKKSLPLTNNERLCILIVKVRKSRRWSMRYLAFFVVALLALPVLPLMAQTEGTTLDTDCDGIPEHTYSGGAWVPAITAQLPEGTCIDLADMEGDVDVFDIRSSRTKIV
jgi:hypothetical protein